MATQTATIRFNPNGSDPLDKYLGDYCRQYGRTVDLEVTGENIYSNENFGKIIELAAKNFSIPILPKTSSPSTDSSNSINANSSIDQLLNITPKTITEHLQFVNRYWQLQYNSGLQVVIKTFDKIEEKKS